MKNNSKKCIFIPTCGRCTCPCASTGPRRPKGVTGVTGTRGVTGPNQLGTIYVYRDLITSSVVGTNQAISYKIKIFAISILMLK